MTASSIEEILHSFHDGEMFKDCPDDESYSSRQISREDADGELIHCAWIFDGINVESTKCLTRISSRRGSLAMTRRSN